MPASPSHDHRERGCAAAALIGSRSRAGIRNKTRSSAGYVRQVEYRCHGDSKLEIQTKVLDVMKVVAQLDPNASQVGVWGLSTCASPVTPGRVISRRR